MKVAIVHYWLVSMRGGEKVLEALCRLYPDADIFTHVYAPEAISEPIKAHKIITTFIQKLPMARTTYKKYLAMMPLALEQLNLSNYDLIISCESGPAKGIIPPPSALHICYCHSPMRYIWNMFHDYRTNAGFITRLLMPVLSHYVRSWDAVAAMRVDHFVANSETVSSRIRKYYRRESTVIHPPVDISLFETVSPESLEDYYLMAGELVAYKRPELAVQAFNASGRRLIVIGGGEMMAALKKLARPNVAFLGYQPFDVLRHHYSRCRALIFPGEEDFGLVPVEVMASGRPVIAYGKGGARETVTDGVSGLFFSEQTVEAIEAAVRRFESIDFDPQVIQTQAARFSSEHFDKKMKAYVEQALLGAGIDPGEAC